MTIIAVLIDTLRVLNELNIMASVTNFYLYN
jgi:hypothetical protein